MLSLTTPTSAWRTIARVSGATEISRRTRGANSSSVCPSGDSTRSTICGNQSLPPLAMAAYMSAICSSVTRVDPWPITAFSA